jgi:hypothetical protein
MTAPVQKPLEDKELREHLRGHAWAYFDRHSEQRLKTFNFYLVLCAAIIAGVVSEKSSEFRTALLILLSILSFIFWKLDVRNRDLTKHSEEALKLLEDELDLPDGRMACLIGASYFVAKKVSRKNGNAFLTAGTSATRLVFGLYSRCSEP